MSIVIDSSYTLLASGRLQNFIKKREDLYLFDCPLCGDNPGKRGRGANIFRSSEKDALMFHCYRCAKSLSLRDFLQRIDPHLAEEYRRECRAGAYYRYTPPLKIEKPQAPAFQPGSTTILDGLPSIEALPDNHPAKLYIANRKIPANFHNMLYWSEDFATLARRFRSDGTYDKLLSEPRIVIPFFDKNRGLLALLGRSIDPQARVKYIILKVHENAPKIFGLDRHVTGERTYVVEGPIDSLFLPNCLAVAGGDLASSVHVPKDSALIFDNEPRKPHTVLRMLKAAEDGYAVCVWPERLIEKDINEMVMAGLSPERVQQMIDDNTFPGRTAVRNINFWKRVEVQTRRV